MKKVIQLVLIFLLCGAVLCGCNGETGTSTQDPTAGESTGTATEPSDTEALAFTNITVIQRDSQTFDVSCNAVEGASYYVTKQNAFSQNAQVEAQLTGDVASFTVTMEDASELYLWMSVGTKKVNQRIVIADTTVSVMLEDDGSATVYYNCENPNAVSNYYDANGKALYRSSKARFGEEAQPVAEGLPLNSKSDVDEHYTFKTPYYYAVLTSQDGIVTFVTEVGQETSCLIQYAYASMGLNEQGMPVLHVVGRAAENEVAYTYRLVLRQDGGQIIYATNTGDTMNLMFDLDLTQMTAENVWYDVYIEIEQTHAIYDLRSGLCDGNSVQWENNTYSFQEYYGALKVNLAVERLSKTEAVLQMINGKPMLVVTTRLAEGQNVAGIDCHLEIRYEDGGKKVLAKVENSSDNANVLKFCFDMSQMTVAKNWHDIVLVVDDGETEVTSDAANMSQTLTCDGRTYAFKAWNGLLKITY